MNLIGLSGSKQSGKDEFFIIAVANGWDYYNKKFATNLKSICSTITGLPPNYFTNNMLYKYKHNGRTIRNIMQYIGTDLLRNQYNENVWIDSLFREFTFLSKWIITDVRFENEADAIKKRGGILIRINRAYGERDLHVSETALDNYDNWDYTIENNGTLIDYENKVLNIMEEICTVK